mmetsp:Transcript_22173/g.48155  ORF Transcript_22173/g.48155 Transcript_22173/m.48155 type:complete len:115 (-) Transcript_22173:154-498(-)
MSLTEHGFLVVFAAPRGAAALTEHTVEGHTVHLVPQGHMYWLVAAERRRVAMERVMYDQDTSQWDDYKVRLQLRHRDNIDGRGCIQLRASLGWLLHQTTSHEGCGGGWCRHSAW